MYTSYIGKQFLKLYNQKTNTDYTAERFFEEKFFPVFFNDERHLMHVHNSPFFQSISKEDIKSYKSEPLARLAKLKDKIANEDPYGSILVGYAAKELEKGSSGQVSSLNLEIDSEEIYASWIGEALAIGVEGGIFLVNEDEVLWEVYQGWEIYRKYLNQTPNLKDRQIETWNGHWLKFSLRKNKITDFPELPISKTKGKISISTLSWSKALFSLSHLSPQNELSIYAYALKKMNTTLGFIKVALYQFQKLIQYRQSLIDYKKFNELTNNEIEQFETFYNFKVACQRGSIGLNALEPKGLRKYMPKGSVQYAQGKNLNFKKENANFLYELYQNWIMATLNKTKLLELASELAANLLQMEKEKTSRGKSDISRISKEIRESKTIKGFIDKLTEALPLLEGNVSEVREIVKEILEMPSDNFPLFITLIRFEYNYKQTLNN